MLLSNDARRNVGSKLSRMIDGGVVMKTTAVEVDYRYSQDQLQALGGAFPIV
jgi:hypothetical protein